MWAASRMTATTAGAAKSQAGRSKPEALRSHIRCRLGVVPEIAGKLPKSGE